MVILWYLNMEENLCPVHTMSYFDKRTNMVFTNMYLLNIWYINYNVVKKQQLLLPA